MAVVTIPIPNCEALPSFPDPLEVTLPGGATVGQIISAVKSVPNGVDMGINIMQQVQPALAPLVPIFDIVDTVVALFKCVQAIPDALGPPPNPAAIAQCLPEVAKKVDKLLKLMPQMSVPIMVKGLVDVLVETLVAMRSQLLSLQAQMKSVTRAVARAVELGDKNLSAIAACAQGNIEQQARNLGESLCSLGRLVGLVNLFLGMIGGPEVPLDGPTAISGKSLDRAIEPLDAFILTLKQVRQAVPVP